MASPAHCFYCFECLSASFENREAPTLAKVESLWEEFQKSLEPAILSDDENSTADRRETGDEMGEVNSEEDDDDDASEEDGGDDDIDPSTPAPALRPQIPRISRLQASTSSPSRSSSSSTPSTLSASSSNTALTNASSVSSVSTRPSYSSRLSAIASYPLFVTWNTISRNSNHKSLRGCIGTFDPLPLAAGLSTYALTSAFDDTRFNPIPASLLSALSCSLTLLADFEPCADALDWTLGKHGLRISFIYRGRRYGATYLPDVAVEQGWTKEETLDSLMRKAGWDGGSNAGSVARRLLRGSTSRSDAAGSQVKPWDEVGEFRAVRYTGLKASATYSEWRDWRRWAEDQHPGVLK